jgi:hypothetical protein
VRSSNRSYESDSKGGLEQPHRSVVELQRHAELVPYRAARRDRRLVRHHAGRGIGEVLRQPAAASLHRVLVSRDGDHAGGHVAALERGVRKDDVFMI